MGRLIVWRQVTRRPSVTMSDRVTVEGNRLDGAEAVGEPDTGVQGDGLPHRGAAFLGQAVLAQEPHGGVGAVDLETLVAVAVAGEPEIVQKAAEEDEFVVVGDALGGGELAAEQIAADAVVDEEGRGYLERQLPCSRADLGVREMPSREVVVHQIRVSWLIVYRQWPNGHLSPGSGQWAIPAGGKTARNRVFKGTAVKCRICDAGFVASQSCNSPGSPIWGCAP